jgi:hypothetical protein
LSAQPQVFPVTKRFIVGLLGDRPGYTAQTIDRYVGIDTSLLTTKPAAAPIFSVLTPLSDRADIAGCSGQLAGCFSRIRS